MQLDPSMMMHDSGAVSPASETSGLVTPESAAAAAMFVNNLVRTLAADRSMQVHSGGPTIEAVVREEVRPMLKQWLDNNLSPLVERAVRLEIERVVGRVGS
jgi:cell pole-organizing protein PopZ